MATNLAHGFASLNGGASGGSGGRMMTVTTGAQLQAAINSVSSLSEPLTIYVDGKITLENSGVGEILISGRSNISIIGTEGGAEFDGIGIRVTNGSSNLIIQNLKIHDVRSGVKDAISIEGPSKNIWIDHNEFYSSLAVSKDYYDGLLDIKRGAEYITVSNNYFHDHHKTSLIGYSDEDKGARYVTYDHNIFENIESRAPSVRYGYAHVYNNYYTDVTTSAINLRMGAVGLIENNVFESVKNPIVSLDSSSPGYWELSGNIMSNVTWGTPGSGEATAKDGRSTGSYDAPYSYTLLDAQSVKAYTLSHAGVGHLDLDPILTPPQPQPTEPTPDPAEPLPTEPDDDPTPGTSDPLTLTGNGSVNTLQGSDAADTIQGLGGDDKLYGDAGNDTIDGGLGNDRIFGGDGNDMLTGGAGRDSFFFNTTPNSNTNADYIIDFNVADDTFRIEDAIFEAAGSTGTLSSEAFWIGNAAHDAEDRFIYNKDTGAVLYDADGLEGQAAVVIARINANLDLTYRDFVIA